MDDIKGQVAPSCSPFVSEGRGAWAVGNRSVQGEHPEALNSPKMVPRDYLVGDHSRGVVDSEARLVWQFPHMFKSETAKPLMRPDANVLTFKTTGQQLLLANAAGYDDDDKSPGIQVQPGPNLSSKAASGGTLAGPQHVERAHHPGGEYEFETLPDIVEEPGGGEDYLGTLG